MKLSYRPEVDGLRALAVLLVILHHLGWERVSGGYVGVDVFFVISGYLITSIISTELKDGKFTFAEFYKRRIIRLAPAYFLVLGITSIAALVFMLPTELINYATSVFYSTLFIANFYMWKEVGGYFGNTSEFVPLLHLWSLAVEEQFYLFWPFILYFVYRILGSRAASPLVILFIFIGIFLSEWGVKNFPAASYYLLPTRCFELMLGAMLAVGPRLDLNHRLLREILSLLGLSMIIFASLTFTKEQSFPGFSALIPCLGAILLIKFSQSNQGLVGRLLSTRMMLEIGRASYPAYLWHWPIIAFLNINRITINWTIGLITLLATLILSILTHRYIERHLQSITSNLNFNKIITYGFIAPGLLAATFAFTINQSYGLPWRFTEEINLKNNALLSYTHKNRGRCNEGNVKDPLDAESCIIGDSDRAVDFLLIGDSHANHFTAMLDYMSKDAGIRGYDITQSNTIYLPNVQRYYWQDNKKIEHNNFFLRNIKLTEIISKNRYKAVLLAGNFTHYYSTNELLKDGSFNSSKAFEDGFREALKNITESGATPVIIKGNPILDNVTHDCGLNNLRFNENNTCAFDFRNHQKNFSKWSNFLLQLQDEFPDLKLIEPDAIICNQKNCNTEINNIPIYRDSGHLNQIGSKLIGQLYVENLGNPLLFLNETKKSQK